jgi:hypothetical protein
MNIYDAAKILNLSGEVNPEITKKAYREASKKYHPDINPAGEDMMKMVNAAYEALKEYVGTLKESKDSDYGEKLNEAIHAIYGLEGLLLEICGAWLWIFGDTKRHKEALKAAGFRFSAPKAAWYFRPEEFKGSKGRGASGVPMGEIRAKYGSQTPNIKRETLAA